jgi:5-methylcytosine-specific restriction endonuclease McrA
MLKYKHKKENFMENKFALNSRDTKEMFNFRYRVSYKDFKKKILERDNYSCKYCGVGKFNMLECPRIDVHHIKPVKYFPSLRLEESNAISLCSRHHKIADNYFNKKRYSNEQKEYQLNEDNEEYDITPELLEGLIS